MLPCFELYVVVIRSISRRRRGILAIKVTVAVGKSDILLSMSPSQKENKSKTGNQACGSNRSSLRGRGCATLAMNPPPSRAGLGRELGETITNTSQVVGNTQHTASCHLPRRLVIVTSKLLRCTCELVRLRA